MGLKSWAPEAAAGVLLSGVVLLFVEPYWNDKTATVVSLVESMAAHPGLVGVDIPCLSSAGAVRTWPRWAEEPPTFHGLAVLVRAITGPLYVKLVPLFCALAWAAGLMALVRRWRSKMSREETFAAALCLAFTPMIGLHASRILPDTLAAALLVWATVFMLRERWVWAATLLTLSVTTKALTVFGAAAFAAGYFLANPRLAVTVRLRPALLTAMAALPMLGWLLWLKVEGIPNPFFSGALDLSRHTGGGNTQVLFTGWYWLHYWSWVVLQGASIPLAALALRHAWRKSRPWSKSTPEMRWALVYLAGSPLYWALVRGPQYSAPWYSFPFLTPFALLGVVGLLELKKRWLRWGIVAWVVGMTLVLTGLRADLRGNLDLRTSLVARPTFLSCGVMGMGS